MRARALFASALLLVGLARSAAGQAGTTAGATLTRPLGSRAVAMAEAFTAVDGGMDSLSYNTAGLTGLKQPEFRADYTRGIVDDSFTFLGYGHKFKSVTAAAGLAYYDAGTINLNLSNGTTGKRRVQQDWVGLFAVGAELPGGLSVGGAFKPYRFTLAQEATARGAAFDAGARWRTPVPGLAAGAALMNFGPPVKFESSGDPLPRAARAGLAYELMLPEAANEASAAFDRMTIAADVLSRLGDRVTAVLGTELRMPFGDKMAVALRAGYHFNSDTNSVAAGIGVREGRFQFDYGLGVQRALGSAHHVTVGARF
jgi:hypothetical protein